MPKRGRHDDENEDSVAGDVVTGRFAIADGASTSARPEIWSRLLVDGFVEDRLDPAVPDDLKVLRERWWQSVRTPNLPWYAEAKLQTGSAATFVGLELDTARATIQCRAVGDSCLLWIRANELVYAMPLDRSEAFTRFPPAITSRMDSAPVDVRHVGGTYRAGDVFVLATDAIAKFLLWRVEKYGRVSLAVFADSGRFARQVIRYRDRGLLDNDDTTLLVVRT